MSRRGSKMIFSQLTFHQRKSAIYLAKNLSDCRRISEKKGEYSFKSVFCQIVFKVLNRCDSNDLSGSGT